MSLPDWLGGGGRSNMKLGWLVGRWVVGWLVGWLGLTPAWCGLIDSQFTHRARQQRLAYNSGKMARASDRFQLSGMRANCE